MKFKKTTISIGIAAFNEEGKIGRTLNSIFDQNETNFRLLEIIVVSDASSDDTVGEVKSFGDNRIKILENRHRSGKPYSLNKIFKEMRGDVLVIVDADMLLKGKNSICNLIKPFLKNNKTSLVLGNSQPVKGKTLAGQASFNYYLARNKYSEEFNYKDTVYPAHGYLAYSREMLKNFSLPVGILNDDAYSYFYCISHGLLSIYVKNAIAYFLPSQNISDRSCQFLRYLKGEQQLKSLFGEDLVNRKYVVPRKILIKVMLYQIYENPLAYLYLRLINFYAIYKSRNAEFPVLVTWRKINLKESI